MRKFLSLMMAAFFSVGMFASTYTVAGSRAVLGSEWGETDTNNDMTLVDGVYTLVKQNVTLGAATYEYKVVKDHNWNYGDNAWPSSNAQLVISEDGTYNVTFTFVESTKAVNAVAEKTGSAVVERHYLVVGQAEVVNGDGWDENAEANKMTTADNGLTYTLTIQNLPLTKDVWYGFKIVEFGSWTEYFPKEEDQSNAYFQVPASGKYTIQYVYTVATELCQVVGQKTGELDPVDPVEERTVYFVNVPGWEAVNAYAWTDNVGENAAWPGVAMTKTDAKVNEKDIYSCSVAENLLNIIFNNGTSGDGNQTGDLAIDATKPYFYDGAWYASVEAIPAGQSGEQGGEGGEQGGEGESTTYYLKNNWGGGDNLWTWKAMTPAENNTYKLENVVFGGQGVNYSATENADAPAWVPVDQFDGDEVGEKDTVTFVLDLAAAKKIKATLLGKYVAEQGGEGGEGQGGEGGEQVETRPVYFVNVPGWEAVYAYAWAGEVVNAAWPGVAMTKTDAKVNEKDIYSYAVAVNMVNIIFNKGQGGDGNQTANLELDAAKPYFYDGAWYASVEAIPAGQSGEQGGEGGEQGGEGESTTYYLKNNWGGGDNEWTWKAMTPAENNTYKLENVIFGGVGVNYSASEDGSNSEWVPVNQFEGDEVGEKDTVTFVLDLAAAKKIKATLLGKYVAEQGGEGEDPEEDAFPVVKLAGSLTSWDEPVVMLVASDSLTASLKLNLDPDHYQLKVVSDGNWLTKAGENDLYTMHRDWNHVDHLDLINTGDNIKLIADIAGEYTFTWTYADSSLVVTFPAAPEPGQKVLPVVKIAGSLTSWDEPVVMTPAADSLTASLKLNLEIDHYQLKVVSDGNWLTKAGENDLYTMHRDWNHVDHLDLINTGENIKLITDVAGEYTLTWTYADSSLVVTYPEMPESNDGYYLVGTMTSWAVVKEDQYRFSETVVPGEYMLHTTLTEGQCIKVVGVQGEQQTWYIEGEGNEYQVDAAHAGAAVIYFRPAGNTEWSDLDGHIYVAMDEQTGIQNTVSEQKVVKFIENGQLFLLINGTVYTTTGAIR